jgi:hypothetical protein
VRLGDDPDLDGLQQRDLNGWTVERALCLAEYVDQHDVDLVVAGTHGRTGLGRYLLGSVTEKVVRLSDAPVLTVRVPARSPEESF